MTINKSISYIQKNIDTINAINVFPVFDKDTGKNVLNTLLSIQDLDINKESLSNLAEKMINASRGCSGNILSLFLYGLSQNISDNLTEMCLKASKFTWNSILSPRHGTLLDALNSPPTEYDSLESFLREYCYNAIDTLEQSSNKLNLLKKYNTLDSGTLAFIYILKGLYEEVSNEILNINISVPIPNNSILESLDFKYCCEFIVPSSLTLDFSKYKGDSLIQIKKEDTQKIHYHTNDILNIMSDIESKLLFIKIEKM